MAYKIVKLGVVAILAIVVGLLATTSYQQVDAGHRGILLTFGAVDENTSYSEGAHIVFPIAQTVEQMSIQIQKYVSTTDSASKDLQSVSTEVTVNYRPDAGKVQVIYKELGVFYEDRIIKPAIEEVVKQVTAEYNAEELITLRPLVKQGITVGITERLAVFNIVVTAISITDFQFSSGFTQAIEAKVEMEQQALKAEREVAKKNAEALQAEKVALGIKLSAIQVAEGVKLAKILTAEGEAEAIRIVAEANAERINLLADAIRQNPDLLTLEFIKQWNGIFPQMYLSGDQDLSMLLNVPSNLQSTP